MPRKFYSAYFNYIGSIELPKEVVNACSHSGDCTEDVQRCLKIPEIALELNGLDKEGLKKELSEYGAWSDTQLENHQDNLERILWIAASDISEENLDI